MPRTSSVPRPSVVSVICSVISPVARTYGHEAAQYDARTGPFEPYRRRIVDLLPIEPGDVVLDVGCGTGLCFPLLQERIGPRGTMVGVDASRQMLDLSAARSAAHGWDNVVLIEAGVDEADLPPVDHALFCAVHDVLQSAPAGVSPRAAESGRPRGPSPSTSGCSPCTPHTSATSPASAGRGRCWPSGCLASRCGRSPWAGATWRRAGCPPTGHGMPAEVPQSGNAGPDAPSGSKMSW